MPTHIPERGLTAANIIAKQGNLRTSEFTANDYQSFLRQRQGLNVIRKLFSVLYPCDDGGKSREYYFCERQLDSYNIIHGHNKLSPKNKYPADLLNILGLPRQGQTD